MDIHHIIGVAGVVFMASLTQSAIGLGFALIGSPLLVLLGVSLPAAMTMVYVCSFFQSAVGAWSLRSSAPWKTSLTASLVIVTTAFAGLIVLKKMIFYDPAVVKVVVGSVLCLLSAAQLFFMVRPLKTRHWFWAALAFSASGALTGICGMGGPPLVIWAISRDWPVKKTRGFLFSVFIILIPTQIILLRATFGYDIIRALLDSLPLIPVVLIGTLIGLPLGDKIPKKTFGKIVNLILLIIGLALIIPSI